MQPSDTLYNGRTIRTYTGQYVDVFDPKPETINVIDLAIGQAYENRWSNQNRVHYSVAQHACIVHDFLPDHYKRQGLFHDSSEGLVGDMSRPIKKSLPEFQTIEDNLMHVIAAKFGFDWPKYDEVDQIDKALMRLEHNAFMITRKPILLDPWPAEKALFEWLKRAINVLEISIDIHDGDLDHLLLNPPIELL